MRVGLFLILSLIIGYGSDWIPYYISVFSSAERLQILGRLQPYESPCSSGDNCAFRYIIPKTEIQSFLTNGAVGIGTVLYASKIYCSNGPTLAIHDDPNDPGKRYDTYNLYQTANFEGMKCDGNLIVEAFGRPSSRRTGYVGGALVVGENSMVDQVKRSTEFFSSDIRLLITFIVAFAIFISWFFEKIANFSVAPSVFDLISPFMIGFLLVSSGTLQIALPFLEPTLFSRISGFFSIMAHIAPAIIFLARHGSRVTPDRKRTARIVLVSCGIGTLVLTASPWFMSSFAILFTGSAIILFGAAIAQRDLLMIVYAICLAFLAAKLSAIDFTPHPHLGALFTAFLYTDRAATQVRLAAHLSKISRWFHNTKIPASKWHTFELDIFRTFLAHVPAKRITLLKYLHEGENEISIFKADQTGRISFERFSRIGVPDVFAHVFSTKEPLWHLDHNSELSASLRRTKRNPTTFENPLFSVIPIEFSGRVIGALALTDYDSKLPHNPEADFAFKEIVTTFRTHLADFVSRVSDWKKVQARTLEVNLSDRLKTLRTRMQNGEYSHEELLQKSAEAIAEALDASCYIAKLDPISRRLEIEGIAGFLTSVQAQIKTGNIFAHKENVQGPIALTINKNKPIIVPDVQTISGVIHPISRELFKRNQTRSCAGIPIPFPDSSEIFRDPSTPWGILWIESRRLGDLNANSEFTLTSAVGVLLDTIALFSVRKKIQETLDIIGEFLPAAAKEKMLAGKDPTETDCGYIVMIDLMSSSKVSQQKPGASAWFRDLVHQELSPVAESLASRHGLVLQSVIWDAFFFTLSCPSISKLHQSSIIAFCDEALETINDVYKQKVREITGMDLGSGLKVRSCIRFGDISRGLSAGSTSNWTIVGHEMAVINKLEAACKNMTGKCFITTDLLIPDATYQVVPTGVKISGSDAEVVEIRTKNINAVAA